uniref:hypothetical protein n=1 Tax=Frankia sp. Cr1 TaxID=3073931 RepID=UPI002AD3BC61
VRGTLQTDDRDRIPPGLAERICMIAPDKGALTPLFSQVSRLSEAEEKIRGGGNDSPPGVGHRGGAPQTSA